MLPKPVVVLSLGSPLPEAPEPEPPQQLCSTDNDDNVGEMAKT